MPSQQQQQQQQQQQPDKDAQDAFNFSFLKGPKRKRLAKACDPCHKSKRRCDGTAPCSNCYFASKDCTYTDAAGRPVPAPRSAPPNSDRAQPRPHPPAPDSASSSSSHSASTRRHAPRPGPSHPPTHPTIFQEPSTSRIPLDPSGDHVDQRKRPRIADPEPDIDLPPPASLEPPVVRDLVNLFFAHAHPQRLIFHMPTFYYALSLARVPPYVLHAVCGLAMPLSRYRTPGGPPRLAGHAHYVAAIGLMFDNAGRLLVERNLYTVQALCVLQSHELLSSYPWTPSTRCFDLALQILEGDLRVHAPDSDPGQTSCEERIARETARRCLWLIRLQHLIHFTYHSIPLPPRAIDLTLRLPVCEAAFEVGMAVGWGCAEYVNAPAPRAASASEFGHLLRIATIHWAMVGTIRAADDGRADRGAIEAAVQETTQQLMTWEESLVVSLRFCEMSAKEHAAMFDAGSSTSAWCYFMMHILHASTVLALCDGREKVGLPLRRPSDAQLAREQVFRIMQLLGARASYNVIAIAALLPLHKYGQNHNPEVQRWIHDFEEVWGTRLPPVPVSLPLPAPPIQADISTLLANPAPPSTMPAPSSTRESISPADEQSESSSAAYYRSLGHAYTQLRRPKPQAHTPPPRVPSLVIQAEFEKGGKRTPSVSANPNAGFNLIDGTALLPSLKSSGLLDSWESVIASGSGGGSHGSSSSHGAGGFSGSPAAAGAAGPSSSPTPSLVSSAPSSGLNGGGKIPSPLGREVDLGGGGPGSGSGSMPPGPSAMLAAAAAGRKASAPMGLPWLEQEGRP
ncbi:hypothetical protein OF83DRAFT_1101684 [Amylostereum chailletii]|nr:hypothetical protein OF83DRAFT_1101684 [Amylostereum chailletii]